MSQNETERTEAGPNSGDVNESGESGMDQACRGHNDVTGPVTIDFLQVSGGAKTLMINYYGQHYMLRATRNGKLILNK